MKSVVRFYKTLSHCSNTVNVIHTLYNTAVSQLRYVHQFIAVLDVNLSWPAYRLDSEVYRSIFYVSSFVDLELLL